MIDIWDWILLTRGCWKCGTVFVSYATPTKFLLLKLRLHNRKTCSCFCIQFYYIQRCSRHDKFKNVLFMILVVCFSHCWHSTISTMLLQRQWTQFERKVPHDQHPGNKMINVKHNTLTKKKKKLVECPSCSTIIFNNSLAHPKTFQNFLED